MFMESVATIISQNAHYGLFVASILAQSYFNWRKSINKQSKHLKKAKKPKEVTWLDTTKFQVLVAICDAFIPEFAADEVNFQALKKAMVGFGETSLLNETDVEKHKQHLMRGALSMKVPEFTALSFQASLIPEDQEKLALFLNILSSAPGCFLLTGFAAPFQDLPLEKRIAALLKLRDSPLQDMRAAYQNFKRMTGNLFLSLSSRDKANPAWEHMDYQPVNKPKQSTCSSSNADSSNACHESTHKHTFSPESNPSVFSFWSDKAFDPVSKAPIGQFQSTAKELPGKWTLEADAIIVGSGAGGGTLAYELVQAGLDVIVLEKGGYFTEREFTEWRELEAFGNTFDRGGLMGSADGNIVILAGSCVGGGSTINWSASFATPTYVLKDWESKDLPQFAPNGSFAKSLEAAHALFGVNSRFSYRHDHATELEYNAKASPSVLEDDDPNFVVNKNNALLWKGALAKGFKPARIPRNVSSCVDCGHCCFGCSHSSKLSTVHNLMQPILELQTSGDYSFQRGSVGRLRIIPYCHVDSILSRNVDNNGRFDDAAGYSRQAEGVEATVLKYPQSLRPAPGSTAAVAGIDIAPVPISSTPLVIRSKIVVAAGGSIQTPALLLRSGFKNAKIGKHLSLHPVTAIGGLFPNIEVGGSVGTSMGVVVNDPPIEAEGPGQSGWRLAIETPPVHPGLFGSLIPWNGSGLTMKAHMLMFKHLATFLVLSRDRSQECNRVVIDKHTGQAVIHYAVAEVDKPMVRKGLESQFEVMRAAGAQVILPIHESFPFMTNPRNEAAAKVYVDNLLADCLTPSKAVIFSAHQMGSCRMASTPVEGVVRPTGETWECRNLFIADASVFPTSLGINPMITVAAFAHMISKSVIARSSMIYSLGQSSSSGKVSYEK